MSKPKKYYNASFKEKAVKLSHARGSVKEISEELDVSYSVLCRWRKEYADLGKNSFPGKGKPKQTDEEREIAQLKKRLRDAELERDILKKAISIFSTSDRKSLDL